MEKVAIIVLNYNGLKFLNGCFSSLKKLNYPDFEVTMVDDFSSDDSVAYTAKNFPWVKILQNDKNLGACISFNRAVKRTKAGLIVKIDNDVIVDKNWLKEMVATLESDPEIGVVGSKILNYDGKSIQEYGSNIDRTGYPMNYLYLKGSPKYISGTHEVFYVSGCSMLFRKKVFERVGMFDEKFYIYKDDLDLCWRLKLFGYKTVTNFNSVLCHLSGVTQGGTTVRKKIVKYSTTFRKRYFGERNTLRMLLKNYAATSLLQVLPFYFFIIFAEVAYFTFKRQCGIYPVFLQVFWWNILNLPDTVKERQRIQQGRTVPDNLIMTKMAKGSLKWEMLGILKTLQID